MHNRPTTVDKANEFFDRQIKPALADICSDKNAMPLLQRLLRQDLEQRQKALLHELADVTVSLALLELEDEVQKRLEEK